MIFWRFYTVIASHWCSHTKLCDTKLKCPVGVWFWFGKWYTLFSEMVQRWWRFFSLYACGISFSTNCVVSSWRRSYWCECIECEIIQKRIFSKQFQSLISFHSFVLLNNFQFKNCSKNLITLKRADLSTAGNYRCEFSTDAPTFHTITRDGALKVFGESYESLNEMFIDQKHCKMFIASFLSLWPDILFSAPPKHGPKITGQRFQYEIGDSVNVTCT